MNGSTAVKRRSPGAGADIAGPPSWPGWDYDIKLYKTYAKQIREAFDDAIKDSSGNITAWWSGELTTTRQGLLHLISDSIEKAVGKSLYLLWTEAYFLGDRSAAAVAAHKSPDFGHWTPGDPGTAEAADIAGHIQHLLDAYGISLIQSIASTRMRELGAEISNAVSKGEKPEDLIARLPRILLTDMRADSIARTETMRGISAAALARYKRMGATHKTWELGPRACGICKRNNQNGLIPLDSLYVSGDLTPPAHPGCRCAAIGHIPSSFGGQLDKRRRVSFNGRLLPNAEDGTYHSEPGAGFTGGNVTQPPNPSGPGWGGGGQQMHPHDAAGIQYEDIPGASWGTEPPRWDYGPAGPGGAFGNGDINRVPGEDRWPQGGHGSEQPPGEWDNYHGRNPFYALGERQGTDFADMSEPHERDEEEPEDGDDGQFPFRRGRAPNAVGKRGKKSKPWKNKSLPVDERVYRQLDEDYPDVAINWVRHVTWKEPQEVPTSKIDYSAEDSWISSGHDARVNKIVEKLKKRAAQGKHGKPIVMVKSPGNKKCIVIDGHHRALAYRKAGIPAWGYVALVSKNKGPWLRTHHQQETNDDTTGSTHVQKDAANYADANPVEAEHVMNQVRANYPEDSIEWMKDAHWLGPINVPLDRVDFGSAGKWAAFHQQSRVDQFMKMIKQGESVNPVIAVQRPDSDKAMIVDGHHRSLAFKELQKPIPAYIGIVHSDTGPWDKTHLHQVHQGADPQNKKKKDKKPRAAGIVVQAKDTGRILMLQRHLDD